MRICPRCNSSQISLYTGADFICLVCNKLFGKFHKGQIVRVSVNETKNLDSDLCYLRGTKVRIKDIISDKRVAIKSLDGSPIRGHWPTNFLEEV